MQYKNEEELNESKIPLEKRTPQGAFGVDEMYLIELQDQIHELGQQEANDETSIKFIDTVNKLNARSPYIKILLGSTVMFVSIAFVISYNITQPNFSSTVLSFISNVFTTDLLLFVSIGIITQLLDGALGMGYGVACSSFLLGLGLTPAYTSATVHLAKSLNIGVSSISHLSFKNLNQKLFRSLLVPGILGSVLGAWLLADVLNNELVKPFIALYLLILGFLILIKPLKKAKQKKRVKRISWLAVLGGFVDSIGGGGWGPIVTSNLLQKGRVTSYSVGSVNIVEFFVALAASLTFIYFGHFSGWQAIIGLVIGGILAYPFTSFFVSKINRVILTLALGALVIGFSIHTFLTSNYAILISFFR